MAPGAQKKFYSGIYALTPGDNGQAEATLIGHLPEPMAYGASATTPEGLVIIGGTSASEPLRQVAMITVSDDGEAVVTSLLRCLRLSTIWRHAMPEEASMW